MADSCPANPDTILRQIVTTSKRTLAVWGIASLVILIAVIFVAYSLVQEIMHWHTTNRARKIRLRGRNNPDEAADDDYAPRPAKQYTAPSGRTIRYQLAKNQKKETLDRSKDNYEPEETKDEDEEEDE